jgi:23S rRNA maturation mini-RNase III
MPAWIRETRRARTSRTNRSPAIAAVGAVVTMAVALAVLYSYYIREIHVAQIEALRATVARTASEMAQARHAPATLPALTSQRPMSTINGRPAIVHDTPMNKADIAAWEAKNAESMRIIEKTTPSLPP